MTTKQSQSKQVKYSEAVQSKIFEDPDHFFENILGVTFWEKQKEIVESIKNNRRTSVRSCNSAGKTYSVARIGMWFLFAFPHSLVVNTAPTNRQVVNQYWRHYRNA